MEYVPGNEINDSYQSYVASTLNKKGEQVSANKLISIPIDTFSVIMNDMTIQYAEQYNGKMITMSLF